MTKVVQFTVKTEGERLALDLMSHVEWWLGVWGGTHPEGSAQWEDEESMRRAAATLYEYFCAKEVEA